jgi:hypothetical protein
VNLAEPFNVRLTNERRCPDISVSALSRQLRHTEFVDQGYGIVTDDIKLGLPTLAEKTALMSLISSELSVCW